MILYIENSKHATTKTFFLITCYLSLQEKLQVALQKLRNKQRLTEKLEVDVAKKKAAWKARVMS